MKEDIIYADFEKEDFDDLLHMSLKLWKDYDEHQLRKILEQTCDLDNQRIFLAKNSQSLNIAFAILSVRTDSVEGAEKSPTGYLEGIYVDPSFRTYGIAKNLVRIGEKWLKKNNCTQIGSDTWLTAIESRKFHAKLGFWEEDELVHFLKDIK